MTVKTTISVSIDSELVKLAREKGKSFNISRAAEAGIAKELGKTNSLLDEITKRKKQMDERMAKFRVSI